MAGSSVRAAILREPGAAVEIADVRLDPPGPGEVEVRIAAAGVCGSDLHVVVGDWDVPTPVVLGHEGAGVVTRVGDGRGRPRRAATTSSCPGCRSAARCRQCRAGRPWQCELVAEVVAPGGVLHDGTSRWHAATAGRCTTTSASPPSPSASSSRAPGR